MLKGGVGGGEKLGCLKLYFERFEGGIVKTHAAKTETWIFRKIFRTSKFKVFWKIDYLLCILKFENNNGNVTI